MYTNFFFITNPLIWISYIQTWCLKQYILIKISVVLPDTFFCDWYGVHECVHCHRRLYGRRSMERPVTWTQRVRTRLYVQGLDYRLLQVRSRGVSWCRKKWPVGGWNADKERAGPTGVGEREGTARTRGLILRGRWAPRDGGRPPAHAGVKWMTVFAPSVIRTGAR